MMSWVVGGGGASQTGFGEMMRTRRKMKWTSRWTAIFLVESSNSLRTSLFVCLLFVIRDLFLYRICMNLKRKKRVTGTHGCAS